MLLVQFSLFNRLIIVYNTSKNRRMFEPKYTITPVLLANIKRIAQVVASLNERRFPQVVTFEMEKAARVI
mgnify:FL=1